MSGGERFEKVGYFYKDSNKDCVILPLVMLSKWILRSFIMSTTTINYQVAGRRGKMPRSMEKVNMILPLTVRTWFSHKGWGAKI